MDKKEEFRKYLEKTKVISVLTKSLTDLFELESRPDDAVQFLYDRFGEHLHPKGVGAENGAAKVNHVHDTPAQKGTPGNTAAGGSADAQGKVAPEGDVNMTTANPDEDAERTAAE